MRSRCFALGGWKTILVLLISVQESVTDNGEITTPKAVETASTTISDGLITTTYQSNMLASLTATTTTSSRAVGVTVRTIESSIPRGHTAMSTEPGISADPTPATTSSSIGQDGRHFRFKAHAHVGWKNNHHARHEQRRQEKEERRQEIYNRHQQHRQEKQERRQKHKEEKIKRRERMRQRLADKKGIKPNPPPSPLFTTIATTSKPVTTKRTRRPRKQNQLLAGQSSTPADESTTPEFETTTAALESTTENDDLEGVTDPDSDSEELASGEDDGNSTVSYVESTTAIWVESTTPATVEVTSTAAPPPPPKLKGPKPKADNKKLGFAEE